MTFTPESETHDPTRIAPWKDELLAAAWPGGVVEEDTLQVEISALRRLLGHDGISTIAGRGYLLPVDASAATVTKIAVARARALLDLAAFDAASAAGRTLGSEGAFAEACAWLDGIPA